MQLVGRLLSPFVRRTAATLNLYGIPYESVPLSTVDQGAEIARYNPLARVPALVLEDGEVLVDSAAILDHLDSLAGPERALTPLAPGPERRAVLRCVALAAGACEKGVAMVYELQRRPAEKVWTEWAARCRDQALGGLAALEALGPDPWLVLGRMTQADLTTAIAFGFLERSAPEAGLAARFPRLAALRDRVEAIPAVAGTRPG